MGFCKDEAIARDLVQLNDAEAQEPWACVRRAVWRMLCADDAGIVSISAKGLAKLMTDMVTVFGAASLTVTETKTETMPLQTPDQTVLASPLVIEAADPRNKQTTQFVYLAGIAHENTDRLLEIDRRIRLMGACLYGTAKRRSSIEVHPEHSEAPHLKSSMPQPTPDFSKKSSSIPMGGPMIQGCKNVIFRDKIDIPTILG